ncbi:serine peptidase [Microvirga ossetica]|uniref:Probable periplasmic serine endoprotease DegP-like n=1 Tax=Microvirga ossetica TaxID=1882682 RepID=A0A1B2EAW4_9HYPH|nr:Do family serine endopeptidase [Microvirga ossetica]ANY77120.1 serine peptidase [Microvirga ossetica]
MPNRNSFAARKCSKRALASVAATAIILSGITAGTTLVESRAPALAQDASSSPTMLGQTATRNQLTPTFADVVDRVKPAVVAVRVDVETTSSADDRLSSRELDQLPPQLRELLRRFGQSRQPQVGIALGSGFFISSDGYVVTNNHVVEHSRTVQVTTDDGRTLDARVIGTDPKTDLALLKVTEGGNYPYVPLAKVTPRVGDWVVAIGNPFGLGGTVTAGIISARGRDIGESQYDDFLQVDAPINKGNSGGPTFNLSGEVVGVNTAIYSPSGGSIGLGFAIPSDTVHSVVAQLEKDGKVTRGYLGVQIQPLSKDLAEGLGLATEKGALFGNAQEGSPAAAAGLRAGDVITAVNGEPIADARELSRKVAAFKPGSMVELTYLHGGKQQTASITLGIQPEEKSAQAETLPEHGPQLGLGLAPAASIPGAGNKGVVVVDVDASGAAAARGIEVGDVILEVAGHAVSSPADVKAGLTRAQNEGKKIVLLRIKNQQGTRFVPLGLGTVG